MSDQEILMKLVAAQAAQAETLKNVDGKLDKCIDILEGPVGMMVRVDRLEQTESRRGKLVWVLCGGFVTLLFNAVASYIGWK
jgi:hypothetical protein